MGSGMRCHVRLCGSCMPGLLPEAVSSGVGSCWLLTECKTASVQMGNRSRAGLRGSAASGALEVQPSSAQTLTCVGVVPCWLRSTYIGSLSESIALTQCLCIPLLSNNMALSTAGRWTSIQTCIQTDGIQTCIQTDGQPDIHTERKTAHQILCLLKRTSACCIGIAGHTCSMTRITATY